MNVTFPETSCAVMGDASQDRGSVMGFQTALMIAMRRNAVSVFPFFFPLHALWTKTQGAVLGHPKFLLRQLKGVADMT